MFSRFCNEIKKGAGKADFDTKRKPPIYAKACNEDQNSYGMIL